MRLELFSILFNYNLLNVAFVIFYGEFIFNNHNYISKSPFPLYKIFKFYNLLLFKLYEYDSFIQKFV